MELLIDQIALPEGLRDLKLAQLEQVAHELREELIARVSESGGHFASSLGAAEISVALHAVFDTPHDKLVWDVGHQGYIHKMLTGRRTLLSSIRKKNGISGFLRRDESNYDSFGAGHAGTSISAAVGMSVALAEKDPTRRVIAVIGDGSITAGMALEALNHAGALKLKNLIVLLNDNEMSISENVGAMSWLFSRAVTCKPSNYLRSGFKALHRRGYVPELLYKAIDRVEELTQSFMVGPAMLFESFGFRYIGPVDGHNIGDLITALEHARTQDVPVLIHARTKKGKGYEPAEADPIKWHGVTPFDINGGKFSVLPSVKAKAPSYTSVFANTLISLANQNDSIVAITAAMPSGTGLDLFKKSHPDKFFDVGICEQHAVTFAAGLACEGKRPVCAIYSTFLQRAFDQVIHDVCIQNLPVVFAIDRAGMVGNDGETHQGLYDISFLRSLPNMAILSPKDESEFQSMLAAAVIHPGPIAIRYPRGEGIGAQLNEIPQALPIGRAEVLRRGEDILLIAFGPLVQQALHVAEQLHEVHGISSTVINARSLKPLDQELLSTEMLKHRLIATVEDHARSGGFGSAIAEFALDNQIILEKFLRFGAKDFYTVHASQAEQHSLHGYSAHQMVTTIIEAVGLQKTAQRVHG
jgi:1-deoxy-D-xylulose-5-phosphate synthase